MDSCRRTHVIRSVARPCRRRSLRVQSTVRAMRQKARPTSRHRRRIRRALVRATRLARALRTAQVCTLHRRRHIRRRVLRTAQACTLRRRRRIRRRVLHTAQACTLHRRRRIRRRVLRIRVAREQAQGTHRRVPRTVRPRARATRRRALPTGVIRPTSAYVHILAIIRHPVLRIFKGVVTAPRTARDQALPTRPRVHSRPRTSK